MGQEWGLLRGRGRGRQEQPRGLLLVLGSARVSFLVCPCRPCFIFHSTNIEKIPRSGGGSGDPVADRTTNTAFHGGARVLAGEAKTPQYGRSHDIYWGIKRFGKAIKKGAAESGVGACDFTWRGRGAHLSRKPREVRGEPSGTRRETCSRQMEEPVQRS